MDTPTYFLLDPARPDAFRLTRKGREELGPRFARHGFQLDALRTADQIDDAIAAVIAAELRALAPERLAEGETANRIFDLQFATDPLRGVPPQPLHERRAARRAVLRELVRPYLPPPPEPTPGRSGALRRLARAALRAFARWR
ncbi:MAG: hypothetical protein IPK64_21750 [bacterium]|nr:hypothetical protein [bacterium]